MTSDETNTQWDVLVIGGGPSGMMAAATAAASGATVILLEKNDSLGKKLRITGGGRCNITNNKPDAREMLDQYKGRGKFLHSTFSLHAVPQSVSWFTDRGVALKEENEGRLFPTTDSADTVYEALVAELKKLDVTIQTKAIVNTIKKNEDRGFVISTSTKQQFHAKTCIIATGGTSRPETGSTGDGFAWAETLGHTIKAHNVALVPMLTKETWVKAVSGVSLPDVKLRVTVDNKTVSKERGKLLFTHTGLSGPTILNMSKQVGELLEEGEVKIHLGILPTVDEGSVRKQLTELFHSHSNKSVRNVIAQLVPTSVATTLLTEAGIDQDTPCHSVRVEEKKVLAKLLVDWPLTITGLMGKDKAVISAGGVALSEIDFKTMESKRVPGLYIIGDMLDIDRPSGGYSLQLCWSTGYVAGFSASK